MINNKRNNTMIATLRKKLAEEIDTNDTLIIPREYVKYHKWKNNTINMFKKNLEFTVLVIGDDFSDLKEKLFQVSTKVFATRDSTLYKEYSYIVESMLDMQSRYSQMAEYKEISRITMERLEELHSKIQQKS